MSLDAPNVIFMTTLRYLDNGGTFWKRRFGTLRLVKCSLHLRFTFRLKVHCKLTASSLLVTWGSPQAHCKVIEGSLGLQ